MKTLALLSLAALLQGCIISVTLGGNDCPEITQGASSPEVRQARREAFAAYVADATASRLPMLGE